MLLDLPDLAKKISENHDKSFNIPIFVIVKGRQFTIFFTNLINSKWISELVSSDSQCFRVFIQHSYDPF